MVQTFISSTTFSCFSYQWHKISITLYFWHTLSLNSPWRYQTRLRGFSNSVSSSSLWFLLVTAYIFFLGAFQTAKPEQIMITSWVLCVVHFYTLSFWAILQWQTILHHKNVVIYPFALYYRQNVVHFSSGIHELHKIFDQVVKKYLLSLAISVSGAGARAIVDWMHVGWFHVQCHCLPKLDQSIHKIRDTVVFLGFIDFQCLNCHYPHYYHCWHYHHKPR